MPPALSATPASVSAASADALLPFSSSFLPLSRSTRPSHQRLLRQVRVRKLAQVLRALNEKLVRALGFERRLAASFTASHTGIALHQPLRISHLISPGRLPADEPGSSASAAPPAALSAAESLALREPGCCRPSFIVRLNPL